MNYRPTNRDGSRLITIARRRFVHFARILAHFAPFTTYNLIRTHCHQQYLAKNPGGYCGLGGTGVSCPIGVGVEGEVYKRIGLYRPGRAWNIQISFVHFDLYCLLQPGRQSLPEAQSVQARACALWGRWQTAADREF